MQESESENRVMFETRLVDTDVWFLDTFIMSGDQKIPLYALDHRHPLDDWYHAAIVVKGNTFTHYVNGSKELSENIEFEPMQPGKTSFGRVRTRSTGIRAPSVQLDLHQGHYPRKSFSRHCGSQLLESHRQP